MEFFNVQESEEGDLGLRLNLESDSLFDNFSVLQLVGVILIFINASVSNSAGTSGGLITVCIFMYFFNLNNMKIIGLTQISIFGGSIIATLIKVYLHHPTKPKHSLIDYKLITFVIPVLMLGSSISALLTRLLQEWVFLSLITIVTWFTCGLTMTKAYQMRHEENSRLKGYHHLTVNMSSEDSEQENQVPYFVILLVSFLLMAFFTLARGGKHFDSVFGIAMCSSLYFSIFIGYHVLLTLQTVIYGRYILKDAEKEGIFYAELYKTKKNLAIIAGLSYFTGMLSGSLGMEDELIMNPVFLLLGVNAQVANACCNALILATSTTSALQFILAGYVHWIEGLVVLGVSMVGSAVGIFIVRLCVEKSQRMSVVVYILAYLLLAVAVLTPVKLYNSVVGGLQDGSFYFGFKSFC